MRRIKIVHLTTYRFGATVQLGPHHLLLRPREGHDLRIESSLLQITPAHQLRWHRDVQGNSVTVVHFNEPADTLHISSEVVVQHFDENPFDFLLDESAVNHPFPYAAGEWSDLVPYQTACFPEDRSAVSGWASHHLRPGGSTRTLALLTEINRTIAGSFAYTRRDEPGVQSPGETLRLGRGSCRDFATLFMEACRSLGLAARFASGYLHRPNASPLESGSTHAWSEVYLPGAGWKGFDSTSGEMTGADHIAAAVSRHPAAVPPVSGSFVGPSGVWQSLLVGVQVSRVLGT